MLFWKIFVWNFTFLETGSFGQRSNYKITRFVVVSKDSLIVSSTVLIEGWYIKVSQIKYFHDLYWQTNKVVNGAHLELSTETLVKFPHLGLISLDLEKNTRNSQTFLQTMDNFLFLEKLSLNTSDEEISYMHITMKSIHQIRSKYLSNILEVVPNHVVALIVNPIPSIILFRNLDLVRNVGLLGNCSMLALFEN